MLEAVAVPKGSVVRDGGAHYTRYTSVCDTESVIYYKSVYESLHVQSVRMNDIFLNGKAYIIC